jgi:hypothetical protein
MYRRMDRRIRPQYHPIQMREYSMCMYPGQDAVRRSWLH